MRLLFVVLALAGGFGVVLYAAYWLVLPLDPAAGGQDPGEVAARGGRDLTGALGLVVLAVGAVVLLPAIGLPGPGWAALPLLLVAVGIVVVWRQSDDVQRSQAVADLGSGARERARAALRVSWRRSLIGVGLVVVGVIGLLLGRGDLVGALRSFAAGVLVVGGVALVLLPWILAALRALTAERRARIRSEERAEVAAHVHDSVLQTLTLIQRNADDPREVGAAGPRRGARAARLALPARCRTRTATFAAARRTRSPPRSRTSHGVAVERRRGRRRAARRAAVAALSQAAREAMVNAAKYAGRRRCRCYAEVRGRRREGLRPRPRPRLRPRARCPPTGWACGSRSSAGWRGIGGTATMRSGPGGGTEVALTLPGTATAPEPT